MTNVAISDARAAAIAILRGHGRRERQSVREWGFPGRLRLEWNSFQAAVGEFSVVMSIDWRANLMWENSSHRTSTQAEE